MSFFRDAFLSIPTRLSSSLQLYAVKMGKQLTEGRVWGPLCNGQIFNMSPSPETFLWLNLDKSDSERHSGDVCCLGGWIC